MFFFSYLSVAYGFTILVKNFTMMAVCPSGGVELDMLVEGLSMLEYTDYKVECVESFEVMKERINTEDAVGIGGVQVSQDLMHEGFTYSQPTFFSGINVLVKKIVLQDAYRLFNSMQWHVWLIFAATPMVFGLFSWIYTIIISEDRRESMKDLSILHNMIWESYSACMFSSNLLPRTSGRCLELTLSICMYVFFITLVACYASDTYQKLIPSISKFGDLAGQMVLIEPLYEDVCGQYTIYYYEYSEDFYSTFDQALDLLKNGKYWGIIADHTFLLSESFDNPEVTINTYPFIQFSYTGIYGLGTSENTQKIVNKALVTVQNSKFPAELLDEYKIFYEVPAFAQEKVSVSDCMYAFLTLIIGCLLAVSLSIIRNPQFFADFWKICFKRQRKQLSELEMTSKTEGPETLHKTLAFENDFYDNSWSAEMSEDSIKLLKACTLSIIEYENNSLNWVEKLIKEVKTANFEREELIARIEEFLN